MFKFIKKKLLQHARHKFRRHMHYFIDLHANSVCVNVGCNDQRLKHLLNLDCFQGPQVDVVADCEDGLPFNNSSVMLVYCSHILEHLADKITPLNEISRVLAANGIAIIIVPHHDSPHAFADPTHKTYWNIETFDYFDINNNLFDRFSKMYGITTRLKLLKTFKDEVSAYVILEKVS